MKKTNIKYKLAEAMKTCMKTTSVENNTVKQIVDVCGVSRQSFYRDLIRKKTGENLDKHMRKLLEMYCQASIYMTVQWLMKGMKETEEELADLMIDAMPEMLHNLFAKIKLV